MQTLSGQRIFTIGQISYVWEDVVLAGLAWGDWTTLQARVRDGLACLGRLDDLDDDDEDALDEDEVEAAAAEFRYARDLVAAADLEAWLGRRGLSVEAWLDYIRRSLLLERWADDLGEIREEYEADDEEVAEAAVCEALCSGLAADLANRLAARAAIHAGGAGDSAAPDGAAEAMAVADEALERVLPDLPPALRRQRVQALAALEAAWRRFAVGVVTPEALRALIATRRLDWVRVVMQGVVTPDEDVARELAMCVRVDRRPLDEVAEEAGQRAETLEWWLDELEGPMHDALVGAQVGDLVGPLPWKEQHLVLVLQAKRLPAEDDASVRVRAEQALLARAIDREVANRVTWHETL